MAKFFARYWFPLALVLLALLALPGVILFGLSLWGLEAWVNQWLESAYQLSYQSTLSAGAALVLWLVPLGILLLYFLKLKRKPLSVPSTFLWRKSIEDLHLNSLLQWLRHNVLLLLQLLVILALIYAIMAPRFHGYKGHGQHYIIMIDNSASMSATDIAPNRLEWAKAEALKEIDSFTDNDVGLVMLFNSSAEIRQSFTSNRALLRQAVRDIQPTQRTTRIEEALSLADSLANPIRSTEDVASRPDNPEAGKERTYVTPKGVQTSLHLFSDGRFPDLSESALASLNSRQGGNESALGNLNIHFHLAGKPGPENVDNVGLVALNAVRDEADSTKLQVFARMLNFRQAEASTRVQLELLVNGELRNVYEKSVTMPARRVASDAHPDGANPPLDQPGEATAIFDLRDIDDQMDVALHARLRDVHDQFPLDDEAWLALGSPRKARVLIVGPFNEVLHKFFDTEEVQRVARVTYYSPKDLNSDVYRQPARNGAFDLVIFDRCAPATETELPRANTLFIGYPPPPWKRDRQETVQNPHIVGWRSEHPVLHDLRALYTVEVDQSLRMKDLPPRTPLLVEGRQIEKDQNRPIALLIALSRNPFTDLVLTFPLLTDKGEWNTTWPLQASFPLFLRNILYSLGNLSQSTIEESVQPGQVKTIRPEDPVAQLEVRLPDGSNHLLKHEDREARIDFAFGATEQVGLYRYRAAGSQPRSFAVNLLDADESNIEPRAAFNIGADRVTAGEEHQPPRELWKWFAFLALVLLMVEWYIYNKRVYV